MDDNSYPYDSFITLFYYVFYEYIKRITINNNNHIRFLLNNMDNINVKIKENYFIDNMEIYDQ